MKYRKLRIAWSAAWGVVAVLLCVLWVRSYAQGVRGQLPRHIVYMSIIETSLDSLLTTYATNSELQLDISGLPAETLATPINIRYDGDHRGFLEQLHEKTGAYFSINDVAGASTLSVTTQPNPKYRGLFCGALVISTALAAAPWISYFPRRFSLRTLLIATTLVAVALGLIAWLAR